MIGLFRIDFAAPLRDVRASAARYPQRGSRNARLYETARSFCSPWFRFKSFEASPRPASGSPVQLTSAWERLSYFTKSHKGFPLSTV